MGITIELVLDDKLPGGIVRAHDGNWKGEALVCSRRKIEAALKGDALDVSGVYILSGINQDPQSTGEDVIYIGSGDSVRDRIQSHSKKRLFWRTAVVFYRPGQELHYGNIRYIEAKLIELAGAANAVLLDNDVTPRLPAMPDSAKQESEEFVERIVLYLRALGLDFFTPQPSQPEPPVMADGDPISEVPPPLRPLVSSLRTAIETLPQTMFYATKSPDVRAKVTVGRAFRVFARLKFRTNGVRVHLKDLDEDIFVPAEESDAGSKLTEKFALAHARALEKLRGNAPG